MQRGILFNKKAKNDGFWAPVSHKIICCNCNNSMHHYLPDGSAHHSRKWDTAAKFVSMLVALTIITEYWLYWGTSYLICCVGIIQ